MANSGTTHCQVSCAADSLNGFPACPNEDAFNSELKLQAVLPACRLKDDIEKALTLSVSCVHVG